MRHYSAYGLVIASDIKLPGMLAAQDGAVPDVTIEQAPVNADALPNSSTRFRNWQAEPGRLLLELDGIVRVCVEGGCRMTYERLGPIEDSQVVSVVIGTALAAILMQRKILPLHSCCVKTPNGALLVIGKSGAGKSTTLTGLLAHGLPMLADDVTGLRIAADGTPFALPAFPAARLWEDSLQRTGAQTSGLDRVRSDMEKFYLPVERFHAEPEPIAAIAWLSPTNRAEPLIEELEPARRIEVLSRFVYRKNFLPAFDMRAFAFRQVAATVRAVRMLRVERPAEPIEPSELAGQILAAALR